MGEVWKDVRGFEGFYQISNYGRIKSFHKVKDGKIMSVKNKTGWYLSVRLMKNGKGRTARIHRLVVEAFIPNPDNLPEVNHKDCNRQNNHADNLEWTTSAENMRHARKHHRDMLDGMIRYNKVIRPKEVLQLTLDGKRVVGRFQNALEAARHTGVCGRNILQVANGTEYKPGKTRAQAGGYVWRFA